VLMGWWVATLPMSCYIVRNITTMSVPQSFADYRRTSQSIEACDVTFPRSFVSVVVICGSCELIERKYWPNGCEKYRYVDWSSSIIDITGANKMCSVSVSRSKVLRLLVVDLHWKYGV